MDGHEQMSVPRGRDKIVTRFHAGDRPAGGGGVDNHTTGVKEWKGRNNNVDNDDIDTAATITAKNTYQTLSIIWIKVVVSVTILRLKL